MAKTIDATQSIEEFKQDVDQALDYVAIRAEINEIFNPGDGEFVIDSPEKLEWVIGKMQECVDRINEANAIYLKKHEKNVEIFTRIEQEIEAARNAQTIDWENKLQHLGMRFGLQMRTFMQKRLEGRKTKSEKYAGNPLGFRKQPDKVSVTNKEELITWCYTHNPDLIQTEETVPMKELRSFITATNEKPEGVRVVPGADEFYVKIGDMDISKFLMVNTEEPSDDSATAE